jgi:hypothetical protein
VGKKIRAGFDLSDRTIPLSVAHKISAILSLQQQSTVEHFSVCFHSLSARTASHTFVSEFLLTLKLQIDTGYYSELLKNICFEATHQREHISTLDAMLFTACTEQTNFS